MGNSGSNALMVRLVVMIWSISWIFSVFVCFFGRYLTAEVIAKVAITVQSVSVTCFSLGSTRFMVWSLLLFAFWLITLRWGSRRSLLSVSQPSIQSLKINLASPFHHPSHVVVALSFGCLKHPDYWESTKIPGREGLFYLFRKAIFLFFVISNLKVSKFVIIKIMTKIKSDSFFLSQIVSCNLTKQNFNYQLISWFGELDILRLVSPIFFD